MTGLTVLAVASWLTRTSDGRPFVPVWGDLLAQAPLIVFWWHRRCGWFKPKALMGPAAVDGWLTLFVVGGATVAALSLDDPAVIFAALSLFIVGNLVVGRCIHLGRRATELIDQPVCLLRAMVRPWLLLMLTATILLSVPLATQSAVPDYQHNFWQHVLNSAYAAVGAACLVGTTIYSFGDEYRLFGQMVLVLTTQAAGLGFATVGFAVFRSFLWRRLRLRTVLLTYLVLQLLAVVVMFDAWHEQDAAGAWERFWWSAVHATGATWNSSLLMKNNGLLAYLADSRVFLSVTTLSIVGSLGAPVVLGLIVSCRPPKPRSSQPPHLDGNQPAVASVSLGDAILSGASVLPGDTVLPNASIPPGASVSPSASGSSAASASPERASRTPSKPLEANGRVAQPVAPLPWHNVPAWEAAAALALLVIPALLLFFFETPWGPRIAWRLPENWAPARPIELEGGGISLRDDMNHPTRWTLCVLISATARSAGLQSISLSEGTISWPTFGLLLLLMLIGGSAGGVAGGMRTTGLLLFASTWLRRRLFRPAAPAPSATRRHASQPDARQPSPKSGPPDAPPAVGIPDDVRRCAGSRRGDATSAARTSGRSSHGLAKTRQRNTGIVNVAPGRDSPGLAEARRLLLWTPVAFACGWVVFNAAAVCVLSMSTQATPYERVFDAVAAANGVDLSTGVTPHLTGLGRLAMIGIIATGRVAPLVFWCWLSQRLSRCTSEPRFASDRGGR